MLNEGEVAPDFTARDEKGNEVKLSAFRGERVALYFYPKDDTPGCTKQACSLRDSYADLTDKNIKVLGVSPDDESSHQKFIGKYNLPFTLLADTDRQISEAYGVYGEKNMYGKKFMGISRTTFLIDEAGKIKKIIKKPNVEQHADEVIKAFEA
ncbi:MAG: thioredoxin-dependent thiol peroxidase [Acidobacteriota bacterium]|nr:thioredoxin-dependent thiol peroxidase [Acidobacteriota bacterium]